MAATDTRKGYPRLGDELMARDLEAIDLTRPIFEGMPQWFGHQKTFVMTNQTHGEFKKIWKTQCGFEAHNLLISEHCGTHTDAVFEYDENGPTLDQSPLSYWYGPALCLDVSGVRHPDYIEPRHLEAALDKAEDGIRRGDIVLLYTGYGDTVYPELAYAEVYPGLNRAAALWLAERGVINIGIDNLAIDHSDDTSFSAHMVCREYGIVNTESLTNLDQIASQRVFFVGLPLHIRAGTGSPIRAIAFRQPPA